MASVYRKKESKYWYAQWSIYDHERGRWKQKRKSTRQKSKPAAEDVAREWQRNADQAAALSGISRDRTETIPRPRISQREREILEAAMAEDPSRDPRKKVGLWEKIKADVFSRLENEETKKNYQLCVERWEAFCEKEGAPLVWVDDTAIELVERWKEDLIASGLAARRVNHHLSTVGAIYTRALKLGAAPTNPFAAVSKLRLSPSKDNLPARPFTDEEIERLTLAPYKVAAAVTRTDDRWKPGMAEEWEVLIRLVAVLGQRLSDAIVLEWSAIDLKAGIVDYLPKKTQKTSRRIAFPLKFWPDEVARLRAWKQSSSGRFVFPLLAQEGTAWASKAFIRVIDAAGIAREETREAPEEGSGRRRYSCGFHSLRHTANTRCAARGVPAEIRKELFGHSTVEMNRVYTHWDEGVLDGILRGQA